MIMDRNQRHARLSWLFVAAMLFLCAILGVLQYRWIDDASRAESARLRGSLQSSLIRLGTSFNSDLVNACAALLPRGYPPDAEVPESEYAAIYSHWKDSSQHDRLFSAIALARPNGSSFSLTRLDLDTAVFSPAPWPESWRPLQIHLETHFLKPGPGREERPQSKGPGGRFRSPDFDDGFLIEIPRRRGPQSEWLIFEVNPDYIRSRLLPELLSRHLGSSLADYQVEVVSRQNPSQVIYRSPNDSSPTIGESADASTLLFDVSWDQIFRRAAPPGLREMLRARPPSGDWGRWQLRVRHRSGSLDAVVAATRLRNLAVTAAILLLMLATIGALTLFTRRAQRLATLQMNFVAGVSHELRTPLTVIRTAAFNLRGKLAQNPAQVEKYGSLIQQESERLTAIVEQVLQFASNQSGPVRRHFEPLSAETLIDGSLAASHPSLEAARCVVEKDVQPDLPLILGDPVALKHAIQNLIANAAKYGASPGGWIGLSALSSTPDFVEIRVSDRGPGIPPDELSSIFDPFFRGQRPIQDQIHGTGLGLALVKDIAAAHGGSVSASSIPGQLTVFTLKLPIAANGTPA
jgi:signal transduction histidine kinase